MSSYTPDKWTILEITPEQGGTYYKVFGSWGGGYVDGDYWRVNSGIESVTQDKDYFYFKGYSGSVYSCKKGYYGVVGASNRGVLDTFAKEDTVQIMDYVVMELMLEEKFL